MPVVKRKGWVVEKLVYYVCSEDVTNEAEALEEAKRERFWTDAKAPYAELQDVTEGVED